MGDDCEKTLASQERRKPTSETWALRFIIATIVAVQSWQSLMIVDFYGWQRETKGNRFTSKDAVSLIETHNKDMLSLRGELSTIREMIAKLPTNERLQRLEHYRTLSVPEEDSKRMKNLNVMAVVVAALFVSGSAEAFWHQNQYQQQKQQQQAAQDTSVTVNDEEYRNAYRGSFTTVIPSGSEGLSVATPWGATGAARQSEMTALGIYGDLARRAGRPEVVDEVLAQMSEATEPCRWFGLGPKRFTVLFGWDCWRSLRD